MKKYGIIPEWFSVVAECGGTMFVKKFGTEAEAEEYVEELADMGISADVSERIDNRIRPIEIY